jgi:hypothetical protein
MSRRKHAKGSRDQGGFVALPHVVIDSHAYRALSYPARALLIDLCRQYHGDDNGRLLASRKELAKLGWTSNDVIHRAKVELLNAGFIYETVMGSRPNKASWYALTFHCLDRLDGYDPGAAAGFQRSAYLKNSVPFVRPAGQRHPSITPADGTHDTPTVPPAGVMRGDSTDSPIPLAGHPLEVPSIPASSNHLTSRMPPLGQFGAISHSQP